MWVALAGVIVYLLLFLRPGYERTDYLFQHLMLIESFPTFVWNCWTGFELREFSVFDRFPIFGVVAIQTLTALLLGELTLRFLNAATEGRCERLFFAAAIGFHLSSLGYLALGLTGLARYAGLVVPLSAAVAWLVVVTTRGAGERSSLRTAVRGLRASLFPTGWSVAGLMFVVGTALAYLFYAAVPPGEFDVREYHLQIPREWFLAGRIQLVPHNVYGNMPMGAELHALGAMAFFPGADGWWYGAIAGKVTIAVLTLTTALGVFALTARCGSSRGAWLAAIVFLTTPWIFDTSTKGLVEGAFALYLLATIYALEKVMALRDAGDSTAPGLRNWLLIAGAMAGAAATIKYTAVVFVAIPATVWLVVAFWPQRSQAWRTVGLLVLAGAASGGLWYAKNAVFAGNPVYPLLADHLGGASWNEDQNARWKQAHRPQEDAAGRRYSFSQLRNAIRDVAFFSTLQSPLLLPGAIIGCFVAWRAPLVRRWMLYIAVVFLLWWLLTHRLDRFLVPLIPLLAILCGVGLGAVDDLDGRRVVIGLVIFAIICQAMILATRFPVGDPRIFVSLETLRNDPTYARLHPAHALLNSRLDDGETAMLVGDAQPFDVHRPVYYNTCFDDVLLEQLVTGKTPAETAAELRARNIRYIFVHWFELQRYRSPKNYGYSSFPERQDLQRLVDAGVLREVDVPKGDELLSPENGQMFQVLPPRN